MKTVITAALVALVSSVAVQQIAYRNSMEYKLRTVHQAMQAEQVQEENAQCAEYRRLKAGNPDWQPVGDYYAGCE